MSKRVSIVELRELVGKALANNGNFISQMANNENPQVIDMVTEARGEAEAFSAVLSAMNGDSIFLKIHCGEVQ